LPKTLLLNSNCFEYSILTISLIESPGYTVVEKLPVTPYLHEFPPAGFLLVAVIKTCVVPDPIHVKIALGLPSVGDV
jgi:hypothetical protein